MIKTDCRHYPLDRPCRPQKERGIGCASCTAYEPVVSPRSKQKNILIIKIGAMGDVLRTTFLLPGLAARYPGARISWIVALQSTGILEGNPYLSRIIPMDSRVFDLLTAEAFDLVVNLDLSPESLALATLAIGKKAGFTLDARRRIVCSNAAARHWLAMSASDAVKKANDRTYQYWMASIVGLPRADYEIYTPLKKESVAKARAFARAHKLEGGSVVGINPGAGKRWRLKKWTDAGYDAIIKRLLRRGDKVLLLGGPEEKELIARLVRRSGGKAVSAGTQNSLPDFFALLNLCDVLICGDTLAMHAALGLKKNVVAIFGPTSSAEIELYGRGVKVISPAACACCYRPECGVSPDCMRLIPPEAVWTAIEEVLP
jgi:heptosyltransferase-2